MRDAAVRMARKWATRPGFRPVALSFLMPWASAQSKNGEQGEWSLDAAQNYALHGWSFVREPAGEEYAGEIVLSPCISIQFNAGDCDDFAALIASVMKSMGVNCRIGWLPTGPASAHILVACQRGWYADPVAPYYVVDPNLKSPVDSAQIKGVHWAEV